ncbi:DUF4489 domain-containing protein [Clostridium saccharobutylicum]|uniref:Uncharacterized protein n=1 Tax=Clostridium saccharobutylicum DSM 13864 TaxID=1345695 RepID=U5MWG3_CLOSA|nr:DUF4489 domain-containing protein [Clostridium saccharobutylicum]AGX45139.1 hypothetical protein CLSA_c41790 [Clostridium saccharobutylicum DSM 13864]AQR92418.1 hypothetical protein CLOSC_41480 [Clostridium saccharobutylicum]AQS02321.1 hypothetical protein CSACC_41540 [Clostridium saccharobutylicum]AQS11925.1 hypothetical protein CLOBY_40830 [Clostridium saccharobutylicum]AQS16304.1 hypothetical protein CLOSACC_41540 [Clostridium saccharobutylicum]
MNSLSHGNCGGTAGTGNICPNPCPPRFAACAAGAEELHPLPCPALLQCGEASNPRITSVFTPSTTTPSISLAEVEIDTTCLCFPNIKIEFSTLINADITGPAGSVTIRLSRSCNSGTNNCNGGTSKTLRSYTINLSGVGGSTITTPFSFVFCSENVPSKDCTYFVDIVSANPGPATGSFIEFTNTDIAALAVGCARIC